MKLWIITKQKNSTSFGIIRLESLKWVIILTLQVKFFSMWIIKHIKMNIMPL